MIDPMISRLKQRVPELSGRVEGAAEFAEMMQRNRLPSSTPAALVLPLGMQGGPADAGAGIFTQDLRETIGVVLIARVHDGTGKKALQEINPLIKSIINTIAGWAPGDETGVFQVSQGNTLSMSKGALVYQLDFSINDQLRITT